MLRSAISIESLVQQGLNQDEAKAMIDILNQKLKKLSPQACWQFMIKEYLPKIKNFRIHALIYEAIYPQYEKEPSPAWLPTPESIAHTNIYQCIQELGLKDYLSFHQWSCENFQDFWQLAMQKMEIKLQHPYTKICDLTNGESAPLWLPDAKLNIIESCFNASPDALAITYQAENSESLIKITYHQLQNLVNRIANGLKKLDLPQGAEIAVIMPMNIEAVAIYLAIIKSGYTVISIADSFAANEIMTRLRIAHAKLVFTQDYHLRDNKQLPLYKKIMAAQAPKTIVLPCHEKIEIELRASDIHWSSFLSDHPNFDAVISSPQQHINILFSSGTTADPKAIPWTHVTAIKCGSDAYFHQDIHAGDVLAWPTNLGWMMGPWLIFAAFLNKGSIALYGGAPTQKKFGKFIQDAKVTMLGLVPSLVKTWRNTACMEEWDWRAIKTFSSSGECSNAQDMLYLMWLAHYRPIIEYCGGTEIGGAYITSTLIEPNVPSLFTTPALGLNFVLLDEQGQPSHLGEIALFTPSMGLSTELLNRDHFEVYYADMPRYSISSNGSKNIVLRRHGDQIEKIGNYYRALGRIDDTMNLGAIKVSSAEIERALGVIPEIKETAAIAINPPQGGPSQLIIYVVLNENIPMTRDELLALMQKAIHSHLNPLFKIHDIVMIETLPRTASNKIMRRVLRDEYTK